TGTMVRGCLLPRIPSARLYPCKSRQAMCGSFRGGLGVGLPLRASGGESGKIAGRGEIGGAGSRMTNLARDLGGDAKAGETMKAIRVKEFGGPEVMQLEEVADPKAAGAQVVVRIRAAGVNPVDAYMRSGVYPRKPTLPYTPGTDGAGTVESLGPGAKRFRPGERVYLAGSLSGTYAELALCEEQFV